MKGTGRRLAALLLALLILLPVRALATGTDAAGGTAETAETAAAEETAGTDYADVSALLAACTDHQLSSRTALVDALHEVVLAQMNLSIQQDALEQAQSQLAELEEQYLMGLVQQADLDSAQDVVDDAQGQVDTAQLEQLKLVSRVRSLIGQDISGQSYNAQDFFLTLMPAEITLESLQDAIVAYGMAEDVQQAVQDIEAHMTELVREVFIVDDQGSIFERLSTMITEQGEMIDRLDDNLDAAEVNVNAGYQEILKYGQTV